MKPSFPALLTPMRFLIAVGFTTNILAVICLPALQPETTSLRNLQLRVGHG